MLTRLPRAKTADPVLTRSEASTATPVLTRGRSLTSRLTRVKRQDGVYFERRYAVKFTNYEVLLG